MKYSSNPPKTNAGLPKDTAPDRGSSSVLATPSLSQKQSARLLSDLLNMIRVETNTTDIQANTLVCFLYVSQVSEPPGVLDIAKAVDMSAATASRNLAVLGRGLRTQAGIGLLTATEDPSNYSKKLVRLTDKGLDLLAKIEAALAKRPATKGTE